MLICHLAQLYLPSQRLVEILPTRLLVGRTENYLGA